MALLAGAISLNRWAYSIDQGIYDAAITSFRSPMANDILIVAIDERSLLELGRWPWSRSVHAQLVDKLSAAGVNAIAFDIVLAEADREHAENDQLLADAMARMGRVALLVHMEQTYAGGQILEVLPTPVLFNAAAAVGHVHIEYDVDGVCRAAFLKEGLGEAYWPHLAYALWSLTGEPLPETMPGLRADNLTSASPFVIQRDFYNLIPLANFGSNIATVSYTDVIHDRIPVRNLVNKVAIVGATAKGLGDIVATPLGPVPGVEFNANVFNAVRSGLSIVPVSASVHALISVIAVFGVIMLGVRASPRQYLLLTIVATASVLVLSVVALFTARLWFAPLSILLPLLIFYPLWSWRRLEQALGFLRRELARVEPQAETKHYWDVTDVAPKLSFLSQLTSVFNWQLVDMTDNKVLAGNLLPHSESIHIHEINLSLAGEPRRCELQWQWQEDAPNKDRELWQRSLTEIDGEILAAEKHIPSELVSETIAQLREANRQVDEIRTFFDQCLENLQDAVLAGNLFGEVIFANARARAMFAVASNRGDSLMACLNQLEIEEGWQSVLSKVVHHDGEIHAEVKGKSESELYFLQLTGLKWRATELDTLLFSFTDIKVVKESERARTEALHFLSHDLRSPVVSILALIEHFRSRPGVDLENQSQLREVLAEIESYARKNLAFAESFLQLARAEIVGDSNFDLCDMHSVIDNALMMIRHQALAKNIAIEVDRTREDLWVWGDGELLERLVINLLSNAIKYSHSGTRIDLNVELIGHNVRVCVTDQGIGIGPQELKNIFRRFHRASSSIPVSGAGLGLHFVDTVCKKHGGSVEVTSELGVGSSFAVVLPLCESEFDV